MAFIQQRWYLISNFNECTVKVSKLTRLTFRKVDANRAPQIGCMPATKFGSGTITGLNNRDFSCHFKKISLSNLGFLILVIILACFLWPELEVWWCVLPLHHFRCRDQSVILFYEQTLVI